MHSTEYDLFQPLPPELDLAVMDRFAAYIPGWEMPKNSSKYLTQRYGFITDYLAEAFHHQFKHTNRYEEVSRRVRLGRQVEGRDEKGIKKTVAAFLKILHPGAPPGDEEFEEYVAYAIECRRRVKEQMNKRKPDDEFARIDLSYLKADGSEVVVSCPETVGAGATLQPTRRRIRAKGESERSEAAGSEEARNADPRAEPTAEPPEEELVVPELKEQHFTITYGATGFSYDSILGPYLRGAKAVVIEDPYIRQSHQIQNFVRFCETVVKAGTIRKVSLVTGYDERTPMAEVSEKIDALKQSLLDSDVELEVKLNPKMHDREIRLDNGWTIKIGRGLDFYQRPASWFEVGVNDLSLRKCLETKVDIFRDDA